MHWSCTTNIISSTGALEITPFRVHQSTFFQIFLLILLQFCQSRGVIISDLCRSESLGTTLCLRELYCTIPYYTIHNVSHDCSNTKLDRIMWYTTFWCPMSANSKLVRYISVALLVFKWAAKIFIVYLGQIYSDQWTNSCFIDILFEGWEYSCLMQHFLRVSQQWRLK